LGRDSLKSQLKVADRLRVKYTLILGQKEALEDKILLRDMESGKQKVLNLKNAVKEIKKIIT
jgi:histidyl-tRNA synthetase